MGRPPRLSREAIVDAARSVIEAEGVERLTMRRVADKIGSSPMGIYRHVRDKDELLVAVLDRLVAELPRPRLPADPRARLNRLWRFLYDGLSANPWVAELLAQGDLMAPNVRPTLELITAASLACGLTEAEAAQAYRIVWNFTVGHLLLQVGRARARERLDRPTVQAQVRTQVDASQFPALAAVAPHWKAAASRDTYAADVATLLDGLLP